MIRSTSRRVTRALVLAVGLGAWYRSQILCAGLSRRSQPDAQLSALAPANLSKSRAARSVQRDRQLVHRQQRGYPGLVVWAGDDPQAEARGTEAS